MAGATVDRVYNYWLGGKQHLAADRQVGDAIRRRFPAVPLHVEAARKFHLRAARWCADEGIARFIAAGVATWMPGHPNVHDAAREADPGAEAVYVHRGLEALARARALLAGPGVRLARAKADCPGELLEAAPVAAMIADGKPACLMLAMTLHFAAPEEARRQVVSYARALPPGSALAVSVALPDCSPEADELLAMFTPAPVYRHTAEDVARWLERKDTEGEDTEGEDAEDGGAGLLLVPPGVCDVRLVPGPSWAEGKLEARAPGYTVGALALKP